MADLPQSARMDAEFADRLQPQARQLVGGLHMLVKSAKIYEPDNDIFAGPLEKFRELLNNFVLK